PVTELWVTSGDSTTLPSATFECTTSERESLLGYGLPLSLWNMTTSTGDNADEQHLGEGASPPDANKESELQSRQCLTKSKLDQPPKRPACVDDVRAMLLAIHELLGELAVEATRFDARSFEACESDVRTTAIERCTQLASRTQELCESVLRVCATDQPASEPRVSM